MSFKIYYTHNLQSKCPSIKRDELVLFRINKFNFDENISMIQKSIELFNSEISWKDMWNIQDASTRISKNQIIYLLLDNQQPIGHVWYDSYYLYNAYVSKDREDGDSVWFIQESMWDMKNTTNIKYIKLYVDSWNGRAIRFWEKLGFIKN